MPASRRARAITLAPRSCPSRPGLPTNTRILRSVIEHHAVPAELYEIRRSRFSLPQNSRVNWLIQKAFQAEGTDWRNFELDRINYRLTYHKIYYKMFLKITKEIVKCIDIIITTTVAISSLPKAEAITVLSAEEGDFLDALAAGPWVVQECGPRKCLPPAIFA